jgi:hypothetical protein
MRFSLLAAVVGITCIPVLSPNPAEAQATRTWVSGVGDDVNSCSRIDPCKTFAGAISKTAAGGEIDCLDPGGFGGVTITKSITIDCGFTGGTLVAGTNGITVNGSNVIVIIRNLTIIGDTTGLKGINFISGLSLEVDNVNIYGFSGGAATGIYFSPNTANSILQVNNSTITTNGVSPSTGGGIAVAPASGGSAVVTVSETKIQNNSIGIAVASASGAITMTVRDSIVANNRAFGIVAAGGSSINLMIERTTISNSIGGTGLHASGGNTVVRLNNSVITGNTTGVAVAGGGVLRSYKNNAINGNGNDGTPITQESLN